MARVGRRCPLQRPQVVDVPGPGGRQVGADERGAVLLLGDHEGDLGAVEQLGRADLRVRCREQRRVDLRGLRRLRPGPATGGCWPGGRAPEATPPSAGRRGYRGHQDREDAASAGSPGAARARRRAGLPATAAATGSVVDLDGSAEARARRGRPGSGGSCSTSAMPARTAAAQRRRRAAVPQATGRGRAVSRSSATSAGQCAQPARWASNSSRSVGSRASSAYAAASSWISLTTPPQRVAQADEAVADPGLDRAERQLEPFGDLALGVAAEVGERQRLALDRGQRLEALADAFGVEPLRHAFPDVVDLAAGLRPWRSARRGPPRW